MLGKLYDGRDKTFFFAAFEWLYDTFPEPASSPCRPPRSGTAISRRCSRRASSSTIRSRRCSAPTARVERQPFPGNIIPANRISAIGRNYMGFYPLPNQPGDAQGRNNYITANSRGDDFYSMNYRVDHVLTNKQRVFVRYSRNNRVENRGNWTGDIDGVKPTGNFLYPHQRRAQRRSRLDDVELVAAERAGELVALPGAEHPPEPGDLRSGQPRLPGGHVAVLRQQPLLPALRDGRGGVVQRSRRFVLGRHQREHLLVPADVDPVPRQAQLPVRRSTSESIGKRAFPSVHSAGRYDFARNAVLTRQFNNSPAAAIGQDLAAMLLGYPERRHASTAAPIASTR